MTNLHNKLNQLLADTAVLYAKMHNYHWNIRGPQFFQVHEKTEEIYDYLAKNYDDLAELNLQKGGTPLVTLRQILEVSKIEEEERTKFTADEVIRSVLKDLEYLRKSYKELSIEADHDSTVSSYAEDQVKHLDKSIWMLKSNFDYKDLPI